MIAHLRGKLIHKQPGQAILEAAGVGYDVTISVPTFTALPGVGAEAALHIHTQVREDQIALFGFLERDEKRLFERLITVTGVGPKLAITLLSGLSAERAVNAIRGQDHATLTRIPGVGQAGRPGDGAGGGAGAGGGCRRCAVGADQPGVSAGGGGEGGAGFGGERGRAGWGFRWAFPGGAEGHPVDGGNPATALF